MALPFKQTIHEQCRQAVAGKVAALEQQLRDLAESVANETKSSAGDKYETARAMLHIEQDGVRRQLAEAKAQQAALRAIDPAVKTSRIVLGSLVRIADAWYYLSVGLGRMQVDGHQVIALSPESPLGSRLKGLAAGDGLELHGRAFLVGEVQ